MYTVGLLAVTSYPCSRAPYLGSLMKRLIWFVLFTAPALAASEVGGATIATVLVGNAGNAADPATGYGAVPYAYNIGKYEVTIAQYAEFLNAVAKTDTFGLYNQDMAADPQVAGIGRFGSPGSYVYFPVGVNRPIAYVSWGDAARFANWLHNGQPTGPQGPGTTEDGAYSLNGAVSPAALVAITRNPGATWVIPTQNEWYKAAYYQPTVLGGDTDGYWAYPVRTNGAPYSDQPPGTTPNNSRVANFWFNDGVANGYNDGYAVTGSTIEQFTNYLTDVGAYTSSTSFYGSFDQGGNVWEWNETRFNSDERGLRGGSWKNEGGPGPLSATYSPGVGGYVVIELANAGFRVARVPEPSTLALAALGLGAVVAARRARRK